MAATERGAIHVACDCSPGEAWWSEFYTLREHAGGVDVLDSDGNVAQTFRRWPRERRATIRKRAEGWIAYNAPEA